MPAISALTAPVFNWTTIVTGALMTQAHINADWTLATTKVTELQSVVADLEKCYANAAAPTDKPAGKFWFDSANLVMKYYEVASGQLRTVATLDKTETLTNKTLTAPTITGTVAGGASYTSPILITPKISGLIDATTWPSFSAYPSGAQGLSSGLQTIVFMQTEEFDTNSNFASSSFTPTVAGKYLCGAVVGGTGANGTASYIYIFKNGAPHKIANMIVSGTWGGTIISLVDMNGTTDYLQVVVAVSGTSLTTVASLCSFWATRVG